MQKFGPITIEQFQTLLRVIILLQFLTARHSLVWRFRWSSKIIFPSYSVHKLLVQNLVIHLGVVFLKFEARCSTLWKRRDNIKKKNVYHAVSATSESFVVLFISRSKVSKEFLYYWCIRCVNLTGDDIIFLLNRFALNIDSFWDNNYSHNSQVEIIGSDRIELRTR